MLSTIIKKRRHQTWLEIFCRYWDAEIGSLEEAAANDQLEAFYREEGRK